MKIQKEYIEAFDRISTDMRDCLSKYGYNGSQWQSSVPANEYVYYRTQALNLVRRACGASSDHYISLNSISIDLWPKFADVLGVVEAARSDYSLGLLSDLRTLVAGEILTDFTDQAEELLKNGYHVPAASLLGAVLEDGLRQLCDKNNIQYPDNTKLENLNILLRKSDIYSLQIQKRITHLGDIRNSADHGKFDSVNREDVGDMAGFVRRFMADYLG